MTALPSDPLKEYPKGDRGRWERLSPEEQAAAVFRGPGALPRAEEREIAQSPRYQRSLQQFEKEHARRVSRADRQRRPSDAIPWHLNERHLRDPMGTPVLAQAFLRFLGGTDVSQVATSRLFRLVRELQLHERRSLRYAGIAIEACYFSGATQQEAAAELLWSQSTVSRYLKVGRSYIQARFEELYHEGLVFPSLREGFYGEIRTVPGNT